MMEICASVIYPLSHESWGNSPAIILFHLHSLVAAGEILWAFSRTKCETEAECLFRWAGLAASEVPWPAWWGKFDELCETLGWAFGSQGDNACQFFTSSISAIFQYPLHA